VATQWSDTIAAVGAIISGASGTGRTVPSGSFTSASLETDLADVEHPPIVVERQFELSPSAASPVNLPMENPYMGNTRETLTLELSIAYRTDLGGATYPAATPGDSLTRPAREKAANDWWVVRRALTWPPNWGTLADGNTIVRIAPSAAVFEAREGLVVTRAQLVCEIATNPATARDLG
jgi:hypothetical protein